jgi:hypothetical protein
MFFLFFFMNKCLMFHVFFDLDFHPINQQLLIVILTLIVNSINHSLTHSFHRIYHHQIDIQLYLEISFEN